jgi:hypothetical protein
VGPGALGLAALLLAALSGLASAAEWGTIVPGESTASAVRAQYGPPTRTAALTLEGYDTDQWVYEGEQAPAGIRRMTVDFGLLTAAGYRRTVVRALLLEPKPGVFDEARILTGWGAPDRVAPPGQPPSFLYESGLLVGFDAHGQVESMLFTPPQPPAASGEPRP